MTDRYIAGVPCWVDLTPPDVDAAQTFYGGLFGWEFEERTPPNAPARYAYARIDGETVAAIGSREGEATAWNSYIRVDDVDTVVDRVWAAGGEIVVPATDLGPGGATGRRAMVKDPGGALLGLWQAGDNRGAERVNAHGSVNFNDLHTRDGGAAEKFYGAVFGWEAIDVGDGQMWALPAYGDFLEQRNPGNRERQAEFGAPARFEEAVATLSLIPQGSDDAARWDVTFAVDDADAIAARVEELGGEVLQKPMDLPWVRATVVRDPQGAVFTASQFTGAP
ncbi:VOC family protein [Nocardioides sp. JQ2195]|uniref:VOC family protein n=1 Tax=Nocardioides sp. JQ2195 TaxID=2592334 RepID=UPI00143EA883|nr:VOC family protein [Nocardioides sp. JQ2195]QIX28199.1 VOC family protein [Nocardioides sp. JQ2195]